jgi:hypothetical protein
MLHVGFTEVHAPFGDHLKLPANVEAYVTAFAEYWKSVCAIDTSVSSSWNTRQTFRTHVSGTRGTAWLESTST